MLFMTLSPLKIYLFFVIGKSREESSLFM